MGSHIVGLLNTADSSEATLLVRRRDGQFALTRIDARVAAAARAAGSYPTTPLYTSAAKGSAA